MLKELRGAAAGMMAAAACLALSLQMAAQSPAPPSLQEQLEAQYQLSKMDNSNACALKTTGTVLRMQKPGVFAVPAASLITCPVKYAEGKVGSPNPFCKVTVKEAATTFRAGHQIYILKIDANPKKDKVVFGIASCSDQGFPWKGEVVFEFPKDYLGKASVTEVEDKISELLALDDSSAQQAQTAPPPDQGQAQPQAGGSTESQLSTLDIQVGQTTQQDVEAAMGRPDKKINFGNKQIYLYKNLKITFQDGKVSQVE
jgi:hypothetical protein